MLSDELLELAGDGRMPAECEVCVDPVLERREPCLAEARDRGLGEVLVAQVGERRAAPNAQRLAEESRARLIIVLGGRLLDKRFEPLAVELAVANAHDVPGRLCDERAGAARILKRLAKLGDEDLHRFRP
jgi:hypothetical protein